MTLIRPAAPTDADVIGALTVQAYRAGEHLEPGDPYEATLRNVTARLDATLVATQQDLIIGSVTVCPSDHPTAEISRSGEWEFRFLAIRPDFWGQGIARRLVAACEERATQAGASAMVISVVDINERAHQLYRRLAYQRLVERDWSPPRDTSACGVTNVRLLAYRKALALPRALQE